MKHPNAESHGPIEQQFDRIWFVRGASRMPMPIPVRITRSMTILKAADSDELTLVNAMRLSESGLAALDRLGRVTHVVRIGGFHGKDDGFYRERYEASVYAVLGQHYSRSLDGKPPRTPYMEPDHWLTDGAALPVDNATLRVLSSASPPEAVVHVNREGGILITADSLQNTPAPDEYVNLPGRLMMKKMKFFVPYNVGPGWLQFAKPSAEEVRALLDLDFEHVLPGHGYPVIGQAREKYLPAVNGPLLGCHA